MTVYPAGFTAIRGDLGEEGDLEDRTRPNVRTGTRTIKWSKLAGRPDADTGARPLSADKLGRMSPVQEDFVTVREDLPSEPRITPVQRRFALRVIDGPDVGKRIEIDASRPARVLVGQSPVCDMRLQDPLASRRHVAFEVTETGLRVTDLESTNGTRVGGLRIVEAYLAGGEAITVGSTLLRVERLQSAELPALSDAVAFNRFVGESPEIRRIYPLCERLAATDLPVVIEGETGTGKEVLAEALHERSARAQRPFIVFDCTAVPGTLIESALFGHERGAFTGAVMHKRGVFEEAHGGTLFIDEIGDLPIELQSRLLRALERSEIQRVGSSKWQRVDVRIIAATRRDLDREVQQGRFRDDLFFRLAVGRVELPPLRRRRGDIALLARHFWRELGGRDTPPAALIGRLEGWSWPGNSRELQNAIARYLVLGELSLGDGDVRADQGNGSSSGVRFDLPLPLARQAAIEEFERQYLEHVIARYDGNVARAAEASGIARRYFQLLRARYRKSSGESDGPSGSRSDNEPT
jgi:DNA-binding NtrC family response regulator